MREATAEEMAEFAKEKEAAEKVIVQLSLAEVLRLMNKEFFETVPDETALQMVGYFEEWADRLNKENPQQEGKDILVGERLQDDGRLWKCITAHKALANWKPKDSPSLFVEVSADKWPEIPENIPSTAPWMKGDKGTWKGEHYICDMDNCVWNPDQYPAAWIKQ